MIKKIVKKLTPKGIKTKAKAIILSEPKDNKMSRKQKVLYFLKNYHRYRVFMQKNESVRLLKMYKAMRLKIDNPDDFIYFIDDKKIFYTKNNYSNGTICYSMIVDNSLEDLKNASTNIQMRDEYTSLINIIDLILKRNEGSSSIYLKYLENIKTKRAESLEEAFQRILFLNSIVWQTRHTLMGLGRVDYYLNRFVNGKSADEIQPIVEKFLLTLHRDYKFKSASLFGDTGQIILCGGLNPDGSYFCNQLSYSIINAIKKLQIPDPKILLRVSNNMPDDLLETALRCIQTGVGCPLLSNDEIIIPIMEKFGYERSDCFNYVVAACWEPYPADVSAEQDNIHCLNFLKIFTEVLQDSRILSAKTIDDIMNIYYEYLEKELCSLISKIQKFEFGDELICSCFNKACVQSQKLLKEGAKYRNLGVTGMGIPNVVDSIIALEEIVFKQKIKTIEEFLSIIKNNFKNNLDLKHHIEEDLYKFGNDNKKIIDLTNDIITKTQVLVGKCNKNNERKIKFGLSSPGYISETINLAGTPDGRGNGDPANVHISCKKAVGYTELISFASQLKYTGIAFNGNVVDFMLTPSFIENNFEKFLTFLKLAIKKGFFQMQMNVVSSSTLIKAKENPELYKNLIVRVWGFSAYFNELPEEYKDYLIERAKISENAN